MDTTHRTAVARVLGLLRQTDVPAQDRKALAERMVTALATQSQED